MSSGFTAQDVQSLRRSTGAGMMDAKRALEQNDGDFDKATQWLRVQGLAGAAKRSDREAGEGAIALVIQGGVAGMVELRCETDFVAKTPEVVAAGEKLAKSLAAGGEVELKAQEGLVDELRSSMKENILLGRTERIEAAAGNSIGGYLHVQGGRGTNAVVVELEGGTPELGHDVAVHIAFTKPAYISRDEVPAAEVAAERATLIEMTKAEGKPEAAVDKIVESRLGGFFKERCLLEQAYVRDEKLSITELLGDVRVVRFVQAYVS